MNAAVGLMDGLGLDGDRCIRVIPRQLIQSSTSFKVTVNIWQESYHFMFKMHG